MEITPDNHPRTNPTRRRVLRTGLAGLAGLGLLAAGAGARAGCYLSPMSLAGRLPDKPDANGLRLLPGFTSRIVARSGERPVAGKDYRWHSAPDGAAVFATDDGGWIYVSNSEVPHGRGGVGALRFDARGNAVDAYSILTGTSRNCAGGATPWGTWLSCEEVEKGRVWECDPYGKRPAVVHPALGAFEHEAAAVDTLRHHVYLTEDLKDGRFYRFTPAATVDGRADLSAGVLEAAEMAGADGGAVTWHRIADPEAKTWETRHQAPASTPFKGGEGVWYQDRVVHFSTKRDNRIWAYDTEKEIIEVVYDARTYARPRLTGVDNLIMTPRHDLLVAEDGGDMQIVALTPSGDVVPVLQITGHRRSEITGQALDPSGTRLYVSSQRGAAGHAGAGITYEVTGPFLGQ